MKKNKRFITQFLISVFFLIFHNTLLSQENQQKKLPVKITGTMGITYEGYGLNLKPTGSNFYTPRRPWNQVRFNFAPTLQFSKDFSIPLNFNFSAIPTNFAGPYAGLKNQTIGQFLTNPANNFGLNPKYKWAELLLGTQYIKYSNLSTGDLGIFGAGFNLHPGNFIVNFFTGVSQQGVNSIILPPPGTTGAFKRNHYMFQLGNEIEGNYKAAFNFSKAKDDINSVTSPPSTVLPQEGFTMSLIIDKYFKKGWFLNLEAAQSWFTKDVNQPLNLLTELTTFKPFIEGRTSTNKDYAGTFIVGKKSTNLDLSYSLKYIGAGFQTMGYPMMQSDHLDNTINTRFNAFKNKVNVTASVGQRINNVSNTTTKATQFLGNLNWFTQFNDRFSLNVNYNNFGFQTAAGSNAFGIRNVSNDLGINPIYTWSNTTMSNVISFSYNYSKYDERDIFGTTTSNNTNTILVSYIPVFFQKELTPDFSFMYFNNVTTTFKNTLATISSSLGIPLQKNKIQLRGQLQYTMGKIQNYTANNNIIASCTIDWKLNKKLTWNSFMSTNYFKYGNELVIPSLIGANYFESTLRTGLQYKF
jgi:hypothetical protein